MVLDIEEPVFEATPLQWTNIQTELFTNAGTDLAPAASIRLASDWFHDEQQRQTSSTWSTTCPVPLADAMRMVRALPSLWRECLGPRLDIGPSPIGSRSDRLYFVSYMWFDVWPTFWSAEGDLEWRDAMWQCSRSMAMFFGAKRRCRHCTGSARPVTLELTQGVEGALWMPFTRNEERRRTQELRAVLRHAEWFTNDRDKRMYEQL